LFRDLWALLIDIGGDETPNEDGQVLNKDNNMAWALSCDTGDAPSDLKAFMKRVYAASNSPVRLPGQPGISFKEYYNTLMSTPMIFESANQVGTLTPISFIIRFAQSFLSFLY
jgi:hypothetical protein